MPAIAMDERRYILDDPRRLLEALLAEGWRVIAPVEFDDALVPLPITSHNDLPRGFTDRQAPGSYRLEPGAPERWFDAVVGPEGWKRWLHPSDRRLWSARRDGDGFAISVEREDWPPTVFFGVRPCDVAAIARQAEVFRRTGDPAYADRLAATRIVAVNCGRSAATCFCASMGTGPRAESGYDVALTELRRGILLETGSEAGRRLAGGLALRTASPTEVAEAAERLRSAAEAQERGMPGEVAAVLPDAQLSPRWEAIAARCLHCANCTSVCPTCFCTDVVDRTDLSGREAERRQRWDSCFSPDFTYLHGGAIRRSGAARYRHWMTHKLSAWHDQFGASGCTGCGRCITWCPVGIDITAEARAFVKEA